MSRLAFRVNVRALDIAWFGVDREGNLARFTSGMTGLVPESIACCESDWGMVGEYVDNLNEQTGAQLEWDPTNGLGSVEDWLECARKGVFVYDGFLAGSGDRVYRRVAVPNRPINIGNLPTLIAETIAKTAIEVESFGRAEEISEQALGELVKD